MYMALSFVFIFILHAILLFFCPGIFDSFIMSIIGPFLIAYFSVSFSFFFIDKYLGSREDA